MQCMQNEAWHCLAEITKEATGECVTLMVFLKSLCIPWCQWYFHKYASPPSCGHQCTTHHLEPFDHGLNGPF